MVSKSLLIKPLTAAALLIVAGASHATITVFTSQSAFLAAVSAPGVDTFDDLPLASVSSPLVRGAGSYGYTGTAIDTSGTMSSFFNGGTTADVWLSTRTATDTITFSAFTGGVRAAGGNFFASDTNGLFTAGNLTLTATDASGTITQRITNATVTGFLGFVSNGPLTSITVAAVQPVVGSVFPAVNNLTLATAVPEVQTYAMMLAGLGLGLMGYTARRRRR